MATGAVTSTGSSLVHLPSRRKPFAGAAGEEQCEGLKHSTVERQIRSLRSISIVRSWQICYCAVLPNEGRSAAVPICKLPTLSSRSTSKPPEDIDVGADRAKIYWPDNDISK